MTTLQSAPVGAEAGNSAKGLVQVDVDQLIVGRTLQFPINDLQGRLLLAAGQTITPEFKRALKQRQVKFLQLNVVDLNRVTMSMALATAAERPVALDTDLTRKLDGIIDSGLLLVVNRGPALKSSVTAHGTDPYDQLKSEALLLSFRQTTTRLDKLMREVLDGKAVEGAQIDGVVGEYLNDMKSDSDQVLSVAAEAAADSDLSNHALATALLGMSLAIEMDLDADNVRKIGFVGLVKNWGMVCIETSVREADKFLNQTEFVPLQRHPIHSLEVLQRVSGMPPIVPLIAYQTREKINGKGYPRGRQGNSIHLFARILQVADTYIALTSPRPWRPPVMPYVAMEHLIREAKEKSVDPQVVRHLLGVLTLFPIGSLISLSDGSVARVLRRNGPHYARPIVELLQRVDGSVVSAGDAARIIDLSQSPLTVSEALPHPLRSELSHVPQRGE